ncbi:nuclear transport factor 2 family protein [Chromobacterium alkanivorans]|uniref:nuclear transport factor 2 family protein n=1 Tax=Chromobacterium alkanivorans TaxID=1071719 RepID=UPI00196702E5|nr:nuclear transport factor 2 family protein [Chromobacterium alkanivorans]MBN3003332.1 nuclear transport factor 2 family protein [Chromobacterium alkanivorans]
MQDTAIAVVRELFDCALLRPELDESRLARLVHPDYRQQADGRSLDYADFVKHLRHLKQACHRIGLEILSWAEQGERLFTRHLVTADKRDGSQVRMLVIAEFRVRDGMVRACDELTHMLSGAAEDRDLGSRH